MRTILKDSSQNLTSSPSIHKPCPSQHTTTTPSMPSPPIPRSKSEPHISGPQSPSHTTKSVRTTRSTGSPITVWPKKLGEKFGGYISRKSNYPQLTEESLEEFNRRNAIREAKYSSSSPYYKGLTDFSLALNREKLSGSSPGRESHSTSASKTSFVVKVQEWGSSCFALKKNEKSSPSSSRRSSNSSSSVKGKEVGEVPAKIRTRIGKNEAETDKKKVTFPSVRSEESVGSSAQEKSLRERDFETSSMLILPSPAEPDSSPYPQPEIVLPAAQAVPSPPAVLLPLHGLGPPPTPPPEESLQNQRLTSYPAAPVVKPPGCDEVADRTKTCGNLREYVWADKYRPVWLHEFLCNKRIARWLKGIVTNWDDKAEEFSHFIFEGNPGVGKRTMIWAFLREAFGEENVQAKKEWKEFYLKGESVSSILVNLKASSQHVEVNLSELDGYEKHVIKELITEKSRKNGKAVILYEADKLSTEALLFIRWMLAKYKGPNKLFFCCSDSAKLQPIKQICTLVQLLEPSNDEILAVLAHIAYKEAIHLPEKLALQIAERSKNNLRQAIRSFEATFHNNSSLKEDQEIKTGWEDKIANISRCVIDEQSPKQLYNIRGELQNLIEHNVDSEYLFQNIVEELKKCLPEKLHPQFDNLYNDYQKNHATKKSQVSDLNQQEELGKRQNDPRRNVQQFMRIEEFIARFMSWYKSLDVKK